MLEFIEVPRASFFPNACACCMGTDGPFIDTHRELPVYGRVYVCQLCVKRAARVAGFVKGKRMDELSQASRLLSQAQVELAERDAMREQLSAALDEEKRRGALLLEENETLEQRNRQLADRLKTYADGARELVGDIAT